MNPFFRALRSKLLGSSGEKAAARFLKSRGLRVIVCGFRTSRGEIDIIAREGQTLVFVEVKTRKQGHPAEAVTSEKQRRLTQAALQFLRRHDLLEQRCRFDVVSIIWPDSAISPIIEYFPNAFEPPGRWQLHS